MTVRKPTTDKWVRMRIPAELQLGAIGIAQQCGWEIRPDGHGQYLVSLRERYLSQRPSLLRTEHIVDAAEAGVPARYKALPELPPQDEQIAAYWPYLHGQIDRLTDVR